MRLKRGSEKRLDAETADMLDRFAMTPEQEVEYVYHKYKNQPTAQLVVELEALQRRYGRVNAMYRAVIDAILKERDLTSLDETAPKNEPPGTLGFAG